MKPGHYVQVEGEPSDMWHGPCNPIDASTTAWDLVREEEVACKNIKIVHIAEVYTLEEALLNGKGGET